MIAKPSCAAIAEAVGVLSNPHRVAVLCCLRDGERCVADIARDVGLSQAHVSAHLRVLYDRDLVSRRREWRHVFYRLRDRRVERLLDAALDLGGLGDDPS